ncbi:MAG TPA: hypothetical protein VEK34_10655 [Methylocella sp.]|nr:hypothetical protein [Methylocella sp.]
MLVPKYFNRGDSGAAIGHNAQKDLGPEASFDSLVIMIEKIEEIVEKETELLVNNRPVAFDDFNHKKRYGLLELSRAIGSLQGFDLRPRKDPQAALTRLHGKLQRNRAILKTHLEAVGTIAAAVARAIQEYESDGTYTPKVSERGAQ